LKKRNNRLLFWLDQRVEKPPTVYQINSVSCNFNTNQYGISWFDQCYIAGNLIIFD